VKIEGTHHLAAPRERVYAALVDPAVLARAMPGCEKLEPKGADAFEVKLKLGLGGLRGAYQGTVKLSEQRPPSHLKLLLASRGPWGFADGTGTIELAEAKGETTVRYAGEVKVGGMLAAVGQRLLDAAARMVLGQFFQSLERELANG
jgi:hypothetical protein